MLLWHVANRRMDSKVKQELHDHILVTLFSLFIINILVAINFFVGISRGRVLMWTMFHMYEKLSIVLLGSGLDVLETFFISITKIFEQVLTSENIFMKMFTKLIGLACVNGLKPTSSRNRLQVLCRDSTILLLWICLWKVTDDRKFYMHIDLRAHMKKWCRSSSFSFMFFLVGLVRKCNLFVGHY